MKKCHVKKSGFFLHDKKNDVVFTSLFNGFYQFKSGFYRFSTSIEFQLRSSGGNRSSEFSQLNIFCKISRLTPCFKILALFSPRTRIQTFSRLSPIFLWSFGVIQKTFFASMKGNQFLSIKKLIRFVLFIPSIFCVGSSFFRSIFGIIDRILKSAETIVSKNQNKLIKIPP